MKEAPDVRLVVRLPPELHAELKQLAHDDARSLNGMIVVLLRNAALARTEAAAMPRKSAPRRTRGAPG